MEKEKDFYQNLLTEYLKDDKVYFYFEDMKNGFLLIRIP